MAQLSMQTTKNSYSALRYMSSGKGHNGHEERWIASFASRGLVANEMTADIVHSRRIAYGKQDQVRQGIVGFISFDKEELKEEDVKDWDKALKITQEACQRIAPGHASVGFLQVDGRSEHLHVHFYIENIASKDVTFQRPVRGKDGVTRLETVQVKEGQALKPFSTSVARAREINDEVLLEHGFDNKRLMAERSRHSEYAQAWKRDLSGRLQRASSGLDALPEPTMGDYVSFCEVEAVDVTVQKNGRIKYAFTDAQGKSHRDINPAAKGGYGIESGEDFTREGLSRKGVNVDSMELSERKPLEREEQIPAPVAQQIDETLRQQRERIQKEKGIEASAPSVESASSVAAQIRLSPDEKEVSRQRMRARFEQLRKDNARRYSKKSDRSSDFELGG